MDYVSGFKDLMEINEDREPDEIKIINESNTEYDVRLFWWNKNNKNEKSYNPNYVKKFVENKKH